MARDELRALIECVEKLKKASNALDVEIEIAIETARGSRVRANSAGTKLVYTEPDGTEQTCWAWDWTKDADTRRATVAALRSFEQETNDNGTE